MIRRGFWQALESHKLARFDKLAATVARINASVRAADLQFKQVLVRHSNSVKVSTSCLCCKTHLENSDRTSLGISTELQPLPFIA